MRALHRGRQVPSSSTPEPFLPVLRPGDWSLAGECANRGLLFPRVSPLVPLVAIAKAKPEGLDFLRWEALEELGMSWGELRDFAVHDLGRVPAEWQVVHRHEHTGRPLLLRFDVGGVYSASRLLDPDFMRAAAGLLGVKVVLASVPSSRELFATDGSPNADVKLNHAFDLWTRKHFAAAAGVDALSYRCFFVRDGRPVGLYESIDGA